MDGCMGREPRVRQPRQKHQMLQSEVRGYSWHNILIFKLQEPWFGWNQHNMVRDASHFLKRSRRCRKDWVRGSWQSCFLPTRVNGWHGGLIRMVLGAHFTIWFSVSFCKKEKRKKKSQYSQVTFTDLLTDLDQLLVNWRLNPYFF